MSTCKSTCREALEGKLHEEAEHAPKIQRLNYPDYYIKREGKKIMSIKQAWSKVLLTNNSQYQSMASIPPLKSLSIADHFWKQNLSICYIQQLPEHQREILHQIKMMKKIFQANVLTQEVNKNALGILISDKID